MEDPMSAPTLNDGPLSFGQRLDSSWERVAHQAAWQLLAQFVDDEPCVFDHHGGCQMHGFLDLDGDPCPMQESRDLLAAHSGCGHAIDLTGSAKGDRFAGPAGEGL